MRITKYKTILDAVDRTPRLVKEEATLYEAESINEPHEVVSMLHKVFLHDLETEEVVYLICVNTRKRPIGVFEVSRGWLNGSMMNPREIMLKALLCNAAGIIIAHNHPSGDPGPSNLDFESTEKVKQAGDIMGIRLIDSLIVGDNQYYSFKEEGRL